MQAEVEFYRYVLSRPEVHVSVKGLRDIPRFKQVATELAERDTLTPDECEEMKRHGSKMRAATEAAAAVEAKL